jgi:phenylalanyl-tRNA synthetase beta chain
MPPRLSAPSTPRRTCSACSPACGVPVGGLQIVAGAPAWAHPGRSATLQLGPKGVLGAFGEVHPRTLKALDVKGPLVAFEIHLDAHAAAQGQADQDQAEAGALRLPGGDARLRLRRRQGGRGGHDRARAAAGADKKLITGVSVFDVFEGASLGAGKKSVAIEVAIQPVERTETRTSTLTDVKKQTGGVLRRLMPTAWSGAS